MSLFPLEGHLFRRESFSPKAKETGLHFYIALKQKEPLKVWLGRLESKYPHLIDHREKRFGLTALAVAVMAGDRESAKWLLEHGADPKTKDVHGWTPLHYAELQQDSSMKAVLMAHTVGHEEIKNKAGQTPSALVARTQVSAAKDDEEVFWYQNTEGTVVAGTAKTFHEMTGAIFTHKAQVTPKALADEWTEAAQLFGDFFEDDMPYRVALFRKFQANPPKIYLKRSKSAGYGVFAGQKIEIDTIIMSYAGQKLETEALQNISGNDYVLGSINALEIRNLGGMVNDSFPNATFNMIPYTDGLCFLSVIVALRPIAEREEIVCDYGCLHSIKREHTELKLQDLERVSLEQLCDAKKLTPIRRAAGNYLFGTPGAVLHLLLKKLVTIKQVSEFWENFEPLVKEPPPFFEGCIEVFKHFFQTAMPLSEQIRKELLQLNQSEPIYVLHALLAYLTEVKWEKIAPDVKLIKEMAQNFHAFSQRCKKEPFDEEAFKQFLQDFLLHLPDSAQGRVLLALIKTLPSAELMQTALIVAGKDLTMQEKILSSASWT